MTGHPAPRRSPPLPAVIAVPILVLLTLASAASPGALHALEVGFVYPPPLSPLLGRETIEVRVAAGEPATVELFLDGRSVGTKGEPPYRFSVDLGLESREHRLVAVARGEGGEEARAVRETPAIHIDDHVSLELQQLYVTVVGRGDRRITDLPRGAFRLEDEGVEQEIVTFAQGDVPMTAVLLVDGSGSMLGQPLEAALEGAHLFIEELRPLDEARVLVSSDRLRGVSPVSEDPRELTPSLEGLEAVDGTDLLDPLYLSLRLLEEHQGRRVVILLSDGLSAQSVLTMDEVERIAGISQAIIFWLRMEATAPVRRRSVALSVWSTPRETLKRRGRLARLTERSGGRVVPVRSAEEIGPALQEVLAELRDQYALGYYPTPESPPGEHWREVRVKVERPGVEERTIEGYLDR